MDQPDRTRLSYPPLPMGYSRAQAETEIRAAFPADLGESVTGLLRPSTRIWPIPTSGNSVTSRFGGIPSVPSGWTWPVPAGETFLFLGQIDCAEVHAIAGSSALPENGMLAFFGDEEEVNGCGPGLGGLIYYFEDTTNLRPATLPHENFKPLISCDVTFYNKWEIPDPESLSVRALKLSKEERDTYYDVSDAIGKPPGVEERHAKEYISKFFGWPNLVQGDLDSIFQHGNYTQPNLLTQIGWYHDGDRWESWGPGGTLYFTLSESDLAARRFGEAELEVQSS
jgi:uncharacterized protein YwqG